MVSYIKVLLSNPHSRHISGKDESSNTKIYMCTLMFKAALFYLKS